MQRCTQCILPSNYPGMHLNDKGVCNFCESYKPTQYQGEDKLREKVYSILDKYPDRNRAYDCVIGVSGGRDSSYLLWLMAKKLGLKTIAYSADNGFSPDTAIKSMEFISQQVGAKLVIEKNGYLKKCLPHHLNTFLRRPTPAMIGVLCTGCKVGIDLGMMQFARKNNIPLLIHGGSPYEVGSYKTGLLRFDPDNRSTMSFLLGYIQQVAKNPGWVAKPAPLMIQFKEFYHYYTKRTLHKNAIVVSPFYKYIEWDEKKIIGTLTDEIGWQYSKEKNTSTWKADCQVASLRKYLYKKMLGFNDLDDHLSALVRAGQITRQEALARVENESSVPDHAINDACIQFGIDRRQLDKAIDRVS
jgi:hypothetical protein